MRAGNRATRAGTVFNRDLLPEDLAGRVSDDTAERIHTTARRKSHDEGQGLVRKRVLRVRRRRGDGECKQCRPDKPRRVLHAHGPSRWSRS